MSRSPSTEPVDETAVLSQEQLRTKREMYESDFKRIQGNERTAVKGYVAKWLKDNTTKVRIVALEDRWPMLQQKMKEKLKQRSKSKSRTLELLFPDLHDSADEKDWLKSKFQWYLDGEDLTRPAQDDDEVLPPRCIKLEDAEGAAQSKESKDTLRKGVAQSAPREEDTEEPDKPNIAVVCSRSYAIRHGCAGLRTLRRRAEHARAKAANLDEPKVRVEIISRAFAITGGKRKRASNNEDETADRSVKKGEVGFAEDAEK